MTPRWASKTEPKAAEPPKLKKETLKDLDPKRRGEGVRGGLRGDTDYCQQGGDGGSKI